MTELRNTLDEAIEKLDHICDTILMDHVEPVSYDTLLKDKVRDYQANEKFIKVFGPYMCLYQILSTTETPS
jgi:hypothetical protein